MPVFISYSHTDKEFVTQLGLQLVKHKARVWIDEWELNVGDSLLDRIQAAITDASALLVVLSESSVASDWCKKELNAGLLRELKERRVFVLPVLKEDCEIPIFLQDKLYADFRTDFDTGLKAVLDAVSLITKDTLGRIDFPEWHTDYSIYWGLFDSQLMVEITLVEQARDRPFTALVQMVITGNEKATTRFLRFAELELDWYEITAMVGGFVDAIERMDSQILLEGERPSQFRIDLADAHSDALLSAVITSRRLGQDTGRDLVFDLSGQLKALYEARRASLRELSAEELVKLQEINDTFKKND